MSGVSTISKQSSQNMEEEMARLRLIDEENELVRGLDEEEEVKEDF